jgi:hypothetical protein
MSRIAFLLTTTLLAGCAAPGSAARTAAEDEYRPSVPPEIFSRDRLADIPVGRFCRVNSTLPDTLHEGTIVRVSADEIVLAEATVAKPRSMPILGHLPFDWSRRAFCRVGVEIPDGEVAIPCRNVASVEVYDIEDSLRLIEQQARWRAEQKRIRQNLTTGPEFINEG